MRCVPSLHNAGVPSRWASLTGWRRPARRAAAPSPRPAVRRVKGCGPLAARVPRLVLLVVPAAAAARRPAAALAARRLAVAARRRRLQALPVQVQRPAHAWASAPRNACARPPHAPLQLFRARQVLSKLRRGGVSGHRLTSTVFFSSPPSARPSRAFSVMVFLLCGFFSYFRQSEKYSSEALYLRRHAAGARVRQRTNS